MDSSANIGGHMLVKNQTVNFDTKTRYLRTITDEPSETEQIKIRRKFEFLSEVVTNGMFTGMLNCGPVGFDKLIMEHNGKAWVIKLEAEAFK